MENKEIMKLEEVLKTNTGIDFLFSEVLDIADEIPFGNSDFQNRMAIVDSERSPHRALRHALLRTINRLEALREAYFGLKEKEIEIKKLERQLEKEEDELEKELIQIRIQKIKSSLPYTMKLIKDAIREIESLYPVIKSIGKLSREEFEMLEYHHYKTHYENLLSGLPEPAVIYKETFKQKDLYDKIVEEGRSIIEEAKKAIGNEYKTLEKSVFFNKENEIKELEKQE